MELLKALTPEQFLKLWEPQVESVLELGTQVTKEISTRLGQLLDVELPLPDLELQGKQSLTDLQADDFWRKVDEVAKQVTVRIIQPNTSLCKGSGVIIAQEGNRYTVLTAEHVIRESENCNVAQLKVITPDNQQYSIEADYVKKIKGADLAIITFSSPHQYKKSNFR